MYKVTFAGRCTGIQWSGGTIAEACAGAGLPLNLVCGGRGTCGKCAVDIETAEGRREVLACTTPVDRDMTVYIKDEQLSRDASILIDGMVMRETAFAPSIASESRTVSELMPSHCGAFIEHGTLAAMRKFAVLVCSDDVREVTTITLDGSLIDARRGASANLYGGAVDIGTTSVVLYIRDLKTGKLLHTESELNHQIAHGADVISRIIHAQSGDESLTELRREIAETINALITRAADHVKGLKDDLYHLVLCGNSTMQHLFLGLCPKSLGVSPFASVTASPVRTSAAHMGLDMAKSGVVDFLPLIGGFVGADTTSVLLTLPSDGRTYFMIDLGTNGEIAVGNGERFIAASTACGPALEGGSIECGMRGSDGAIDRVKLSDNGVEISVIGGGEAVGICGSGIIDATAELIRTGVVDSTGRMLSRDEYEAAHPGSALSERIKEEGGRKFILSDAGEEVFISMKDIRQVQLAKSSIYSGCVTLLREYGICEADVDSLVIAGAFGNFIDIDNALAIGLLPKIERGRIKAIGNGAGQGVQMCLLDRDELSRADELRKKVEHLELAESPTFMEEYIMNMNFA